MKRKIKVNKRDIVALFIIACIILFINVKYVFAVRINEYIFANQMEKIATKNENVIFSVDKILFYSSANALDNSEGEVLQDVNVYQYTDIAVYIDNTNYIEDLTGENTIKELYIDNIKIEQPNKGEPTINYKNPSNFGKFEIGTEVQDENQSINYQVVYTNEENDKSDYKNPIFYTDCSNPIVLGYVNKDVITNYMVQEQNSLTFDGKLLQATNVDIEDIETTVSFDIHIKNNLDEEFVCNVGAEIPLKVQDKTIYDGYIYGVQSDLQNVFTFFKI